MCVTNIKKRETLLIPTPETNSKQINVKEWEKRYFELKKEMKKQLYESRVVVGYKPQKNVEK